MVKCRKDIYNRSNIYSYTNSWRGFKKRAIVLWFNICSHAVQRLRSESLIQRIILKFPQDPSYQELCQALADGNIEVAFRAAHTLKGVCQNLGFNNLYEPSAELTERLRPLQETETDDLMQKVTEEYNRTVKAIEDFQNA